MLDDFLQYAFLQKTTAKPAETPEVKDFYKTSVIKMLNSKIKLWSNKFQYKKNRNVHFFFFISQSDPIS